MRRTIQVRISKGDRLFVAECLDLPVVTQAATLDELAFNIREAIGLHLDGEDLAALGFSWWKPLKLICQQCPSGSRYTALRPFSPI